MAIYEFWWGRDKDESFLMEIDDLDVKEVEKLLDEYRESDEEYNSIDWCNFLNERKVKARIIEPDGYIYF